MKKLKMSFELAMVVLVTCFTVSCVGVESTESEPNRDVDVNGNDLSFIDKFYVKEGDMDYVIYREYDGGIFIINITKDSLEVERLRNPLQQ
jgi:hypothetical protein